MTKPVKLLFDVSFPNITLWVQDCGTVEIGYDLQHRQLHPGTRRRRDGLEREEAVTRPSTMLFSDLEKGLGQILVEMALGAAAFSQEKNTRKTIHIEEDPSQDGGRVHLKTRLPKQVRKLDAIIEAIRGKERVLVTRLTVVKKLCENPEAASAFALFIAQESPGAAT